MNWIFINIAQSGVLPHICAELLPKKTKGDEDKNYKVILKLIQ
jgi:hypothetical protein